MRLVSTFHKVSVIDTNDKKGQVTVCTEVLFMTESIEKTTGMVSAPQVEAAELAASVLRDGGNAADALVGGAFAQGIVDPHRCGIGGFGCSTVVFNTDKGREELSIDFHGRVGSRAKEDQWVDIFEKEAEDGFGYVLKGKVNDAGYQSITVPGMLAGLATIHQRFGSMPWKELVLRSVSLAERGFVVTPELANFWRRPGLFGRVSTKDRLSLTAAGKAICFREDGHPYAAGEVFAQPELAQTYRRIAEEGPESFYQGSLGDEIAADWEKNGALLTREDLRNYQPEVSKPVRGTYRGHELISTPLPGGGTALLEALKFAEELDLASLGHNSLEYIDQLAYCLQTAWTDRIAHHGDPKFGSLSSEELLAPDRLKAILSASSSPANAGSESNDTTQLSIVDNKGNVVSFAHSLGYNSGIFHPSLGILFNNCMSAFDPTPGRSNSIVPGKARSTAVAETVVYRNDKPWLVLGSPGASRITAGILQVLVNIIDFKMTIAEAVIHPRFDAYGAGTLLVGLRFPVHLLDQLKAKGWNVVQRSMAYGLIGRVYGIELDDNLGPIAGVDPGAPGAAFRDS